MCAIWAEYSIVKKKIDESAIVEKSRIINLYLREAFKRIFYNVPRVLDRPLGGEPSESIGPWPEFIFHGYSCPRSLEGWCSPCGYSNIEPVPPKGEIVYEALLRQGFAPKVPKIADFRSRRRTLGAKSDRREVYRPDFALKILKMGE